jgi:hypothetical protein
MPYLRGVRRAVDDARFSNLLLSTPVFKQSLVRATKAFAARRIHGGS